MNRELLSALDIRSELETLTHAALQKLSRVSGVPFTTIWKVRDGTTANPGMETVRKFWPHIEAARASVQLAEPETRAA